ncbi:MAG TPA: prenyltransferase [Abditibacterium sp.]|jgi:4-hydroxybenzoate polyprenyltransferase
MRRLLRISRPRFWIYVFGPYLVGALCGAATPAQFFTLDSLGWALFWIFPANLLIYGANDIFDFETDRRNRKKVEYEALVEPREHRRLWLQIALFCAPFVLLLPSLPRACWVALSCFLFFSLFYSAPPIRAKARPIWDSVFNVLYIFPGVFGFFLCGGQHLSLPLFAGAWCWAMAMHAYSAVPDISADREAQVPTIATFMGLRPTLWVCLILYLVSAVCAAPVLKWLAIVLAAFYVRLIWLSLRAGSEIGVMKIYRWFPLMNTFAGGAIFWFVLWGKTAFWPRW